MMMSKEQRLCKMAREPKAHRLLSLCLLFACHFQMYVSAIRISCLYTQPIISLKFRALNNIIFKIPCLHTPLKHDVQLFVRPSFHLRNPEPAPNETRYAKSAEKEAKLPSQIRFIRIYKIRDCDSHDDADDCLDGGGNSDGLGSHTGSTNFAEYGISYWTDTRNPLVRDTTLNLGKQTSSRM